ncbi:MAG TPA: selenocysteine-specific translation elongation factor [Chloroflexota bacterium]|nr:selenocysteine-specific translation elongation factor [Chloroflexota bacterium]HZU06997.1 selenocysteine-specific translation elongation factor [Chloroflexota bacterium]
MRVIGTAGHVDHGKSTLIKALTGIDPDRLQEEKERGMTIDLGFAWLTLPSGQEVSIIDVPGHERFIKNMLAGVGGIDIALLVVAADEGIMPQTREHLAILDLLGIRTGVVAITKRDLVEDDWLELVQAEVEETLAGTTLQGAPLVPVSAVTGAGLDTLLATLDRVLGQAPAKPNTGWPRLPIDRVFTIAGFGTVVTGTLIHGELRLGQEVEIVPAGKRGRIRGLQSHKKRVEVVPAGTRVAVNLSGLGVEDLQRGDVLTSPGWLRPTRAVDVRLRLIAEAPKPLAHNALVTFHTGATETLARVSLLDREELAPGESGWAQLRLDREVAVVKDDLFIIRLPSPSFTIGGGTIVEAHPRRHRRFQAQVLETLAVLERGTPEEIVLEQLQSREPADLGTLQRRCALAAHEVQAVVERLVREQRLVVLDAAAANGAVPPLTATTVLVSAAGWERLVGQAERVLAAYHQEYPLRRGMPREELRTRLGLDARLFARFLSVLLARGHVVEEGPVLVRLPTHQVVFTPEQQRRVAALRERLAAAGVSPPSRSELESSLGLAPEVIQALLDRGDLVEVAPDIVYLRETYEELVNAVRTLIAQEGSITVARYRDHFQTSRKYALALLEHLDQVRVTRRVGDERVLY